LIEVEWNLPMPSYPIELDLRGITAVVVGLGPVGRRKASGLVEAGARVIGIEPILVEFPGLAIEIVAETYRAEHLQGASLVFAAATHEVNRSVVLDAKARGIWVNSASDPTSGDFSLPATWRDGPITLTVSTSGASPALASALRDRASRALGPSASGLASLLLELRPEVLARISDPETRRNALAEVAQPRWLDFFDREGVEATRSALRLAVGLG
jgi:precorrin-2 dehydrogenase/sirohydrochlorin ferrochelatase